jgi:hypothetical protein
MPRRPAPLTVVTATAEDQPRTERGTEMPRYLVERNLPGGLAIPAGAKGAEACRDVVERNELSGVTWVHSYVSDDRSKTFCIYDASSPEAIRRAAADNHLPVDAITAVRVLDPYPYC